MSSESAFYFFVFSVFLLWPLFEYLKKLYCNYNLFKKIGWVIAPYRERNLPSRNFTSLLDVIIYEQEDLEMPKEFRLDLNKNKTEIKHTEEILDVFKNHICELYFGGYLSNTQKIRNLHEDWYFMYRLFIFCEKYSEYDNCEIRDKIYKYESTDDSYHTHSLTDYGTTFYKLYLISLLYVENNPYTRKLYQYINPELKENLKSHLNTKKVTFLSYRP